MAVNQPRVNAVLSGATTEIQNTVQRVLICGQMISGTATPGALESNIGNDSSEGTRFGLTAQIADFIRGYKKSNKVVQIDAIGVADNGSGVARVDIITFTTTATDGDTFLINVGGEKEHLFSIPVALGDTPTIVAALAATTINADTTCPFTATDTTGALTLTADNTGEVANQYPIEVTGGEKSGMTASRADSVSGSVDPVVTSILDVIGTQRYQHIIWPWADITTVADFLSLRFNVDAVILDGRAYVVTVDTHGNLLSGITAENNQSLIHGAYESITSTVYKGAHTTEHPSIISSFFAGIVALRLTPDVSIGRFVTTTASLDQRGGLALSSLPLFNTPLDGIVNLVEVGRGFDDTEIEQLTTAGGYYIDNNIAGTAVILGEVPTTFKTDPGGNPDPTWKFYNFVLTGSGIREFYYNNLRKRFAQSRLTGGSVFRGRDMVNEVVIRAFCEKLYQLLSGTDNILVESGADAIATFKKELDVSINKATGTLTVIGIFPIVTQVRTINMTIKVAFNLET